MPVITEEVWQHITPRKQGESICTAAYPKADGNVEVLQLDQLMECITKIRELRNAKGISPKERFDVSIKSAQPNGYKDYEYLLRKLAGLNEVHYVSVAPEKVLLIPVGKDEVFAHLHIETDEAADREKMQKELEYLEGFLKSVEAKLSNEKFVANAKPELVEKERQKQADAIAKIEVLRRSLN
jgi:valyl-tRNA synthetase